ncbi:MAG TPA: GNAT family N-acetyltransferase, partial [Burkholderiales bacterium]|nr:GNAT family N-acetyltransferase [Burkholderiales bacterium]
LCREERLCGFIAHSEGKLLLHAMEELSRGKGYGKYFWSAACRKIYDQGEKEITSSISASNLPVLNLYASLGFRFEKAFDIYHLLVK